MYKAGVLCRSGGMAGPAQQGVGCIVPEGKPPCDLSLSLGCSRPTCALAGAAASHAYPDSIAAAAAAATVAASGLLPAPLEGAPGRGAASAPLPDVAKVCVLASRLPCASTFYFSGLRVLRHPAGF